MAIGWLLLPQRCAVCDRVGAPLCAPCRAGLVRLLPPVCERCGAPGPWPVRTCVECAGRRLGFATARAAVAYDERASRFVRAWKDGGRRDLSRLAAELLVEVVPRPSVDALVPVPSDRERSRNRGHAPAEALAAGCARSWQLQWRGLLARTRRVNRQRGRNVQERRANVRGVFVATDDVPARVCIVDDVYTTGATAVACADALRRAGARSVHVVSFARALRSG